MPFTPGNIVVYRVGNGTGTLSAAATVVFLDEYTPTGQLVRSIPISNGGAAGVERLTAAGNSTTEGLMTLSGDGRYLVLTGYAAPVGTAAVAGTSSATFARVIGRVDVDGTLETTNTTAFSGAAIRSAASLDGAQFWAAGSTGGVTYLPFGATGAGTNIAGTPANLRAISIFGNQLYASSGSAGFIGVNRIGVGTPTTGGQAATLLTGSSSTNPYQFFFADLDAGVPGVDTLYVADNTAANGLEKFSLVGGAWTLNNKIIAPTGMIGLTGSVSGNAVSLFITTGGGIFSLTDTGGYNANDNGTAVQIATAAANTAFRGVAFAPQGGASTIAVTSGALALAEGDTGQTAFTFTLTRTGDLTAAATVGYAVAAAPNTTTLDAADFVGGALPTGTASFAANSATTTVTILVAGDRTVEATEAFLLTLSNPSGSYTVTGQPGSGTITNDDVAGTISIADVSVNEGAGNAVVTLVRSGGSGDASVTFATADGTATAGSDYTPNSGVATFAGGSNTVQILVTLADDALAEGNETFVLNFAPYTGGATLQNAQATVTIVDNDVAQPGVFAIAPGTQAVAEGATGAVTTVSFTVTRGNGTDGAVDVPYAILFTGSDPADAADFALGQALTGTVSFAAGDAAAKTITVRVAGDDVVEPANGFTVRLGTPSAGTLGVRDAVVSIVNDDAAYGLAAGSGAEAAGVSLVVTRTGDVSEAATLNWTASLATGDTATAADFTGGVLPSGTVQFAAGAATATILVPVLNDALIEADERFTVTLSGAGPNATIATASAAATITNDDFVQLSISDPSVVEGGVGGTAVLRYTVTASEAAGAGGISFTVATADGTATAGSDYLARTATGTIATGQTSYTFDVAVIGDTAPERAETVLVNLSNPTGAQIADAQGVGIIDNDDGAPMGLQDYFSTSFTGFTATGFSPTPTAGQLNSNIWRVGGLSDNANPVFGGTYTAGDFARGVINGAADPTGGGVYSPSANAALVAQATGTDFENGGFFEAQLINTTGFAATGFTVAFDWAWRNSGDRASTLAFSYSTDGATFVQVPAVGFTTPATKDTATAATFSLTNEALTIDGVLVGQGNPLYLRWTHVGSVGSANRDEVGIDNIAVRATVSDVQTLSVGDVTVVEGTGGQSFATFTLTRTTGVGTASVGYATADGSAIAGRDYTAATATVTFAEGERSKTVQIALNPDSANEAAETFFLNLSNATGVVLTDAQGRATITNDDTGPIAIYDLQGAGHASPFAGQVVTTSGVVTAINATGYWIQDLTGDGRFATSDAVQVFLGAVPTGVTVGDVVSVTATVTEFLPAAGALTVTELTSPTAVTVTGRAALPAAVLIGANGGILPPTNVIDDDRLQSFDPTTDAIDFYEALEGMLVTVQAPIVTAPSSGRTTYVVASGGQGATNVNDRGGITLTGDDAAPERIQIFADSTLLPGYMPNHTLGDVLADVTGIMTYFQFPELLPTTPVTTVIDRTTTQEITALAGDPDRLLIASFNVENADPGDPQAKFDAIATEVTRALGRPDIIGLQEVQDADGAGTGADTSGQATADKIIAAILAAGGPTYTYVEVAPAAGTTGGEPGGNIRNGYLYNAARVALVPNSVSIIDEPVYNGTRRPLVAQFVFNEATVTVVNQHSTSRGGSDLSFGGVQPPAQAGDAARTAQAAAIKAYINNLQAADPNAKAVTLGDFNGYYYEPALQQFTADGRMTNLYSLLPVAERYSYLFEGAVQAFDNIIVTNNLLPNAQFDVVHYNSEQGTQPVTDHDQPVASLYIPRPNTAPTDLLLSNTTVEENAAAGTMVGTVTAVDREGGALTFTLVDNAGGAFVIDDAGRLRTTRVLDFEATPGFGVTVRVTDAGGLSYDERFQIAVTNVNEAPLTPALTGGTIAENAPAGTLVGTAAATDPDGEAVRYSLSANPGGLFAIDAATGRITTTVGLDFEAGATRTVTVRATDAAGLFGERAVTIAVTNVNEAPARVTIGTATVQENAPAGTVVGVLSGNDPDANDTITFTTTDSRFRINGNQLIVAAGAAIDYEAATSLAVPVTATDRAGLSVTSTLTIAVTDVTESFTGTPGNDTITGDAGPNTISGGAGDDVLSGGAGNDTIDGGDGNDTLNGGTGADRLTLGAGNDTVRSLLSELLGDTITDFAGGDRIVIARSDYARSDFAVSGATVSVGGGSFTFGAPLSGGDLMVAHFGNDSIVTLNPYLPTLEDKRAVASGAVNGITNQPYLQGDTSTSFTVRFEAQAAAKFANTIGVYEIDVVTGAISDVRIIAATARGASTVTVTGVDPGHQLGFFLVQDGASKLGAALTSTSLSLIASGGQLVLANNGTAVAGITTFFSHSAAANPDGQAHVLSGVTSDGSGAIRIGWEDLLRSGKTDDDFQDVVLTVEAVRQPHPVSAIGDAFVTADTVQHDAFAALVPLEHNPVLVIA